MKKRAIVRLTSISEVMIEETVNGDQTIEDVLDTREIEEFEVLEEI